MGQEVCPNCGKLVSELVDTTGWCGDCSELIRCQKCGVWFPSETSRPHCKSCQRELWLEENADAIEVQMLNGLSFSMAKEKVLENNRNGQHCANCGDHLPKKGMFCSKHECRLAYTRYHRRIKRGIDTQTALREALKT